MILYKYMSFDDALLTLNNRTLAFSHLEDFNDPFECTTLGLYDHVISKRNSNEVLQQKFSRKYLITCLTKQPLNPLMWAHYADSHNGVVIGIDVNKAGLNDADKFIITADCGSVTYLSEEPKNLNRCTVEFLNNVENLTWGKDKEILKQALLNKMHFWKYEEEVRIVKKISPYISTYYIPRQRKYNFDGQVWQKIKPGFKPIYTLEINPDAFVDVTFGLGSYRKLRRSQEKETNTWNPDNIEKLDRLYNLCRSLSLPVFKVDKDYDRWGLTRKNIDI